jgi:Raf kinase inhibitor-like YbhB/YbcL family protein
MKLEIPSFGNGDRIPFKYALCKPADEGHVTFADNLNPHLKWGDAPEGTKSFAIICVDTKVPSKPDDVNQEHREVPAELPRVDFYHWVLTDIPTSINEIKEGAVSQGVTPHGKEIGKTDYGVNGINSYTDWFKGDTNMEGNWGGYDGPCPPWNDSLIHEYFFTVYALDTDFLDLKGAFQGSDALKAMEGHILDKAQWMGTFTLNKRLL